MAFTKDSSVVTTYIIDKLEDNLVALGLKAVYRGDQNLIPEYPAATVRSGPKRRDYATTRQYGIEFQTIILVMYGVIGQVELSELAVEEHAEAIENLLHDDRKLGPAEDPLVINSWVSAVDPGTRVTSSANIKTTRITHRATSREVF